MINSIKIRNFLKKNSCFFLQYHKIPNHKHTNADSTKRIVTAAAAAVPFRQCRFYQLNMFNKVNNINGYFIYFTFYYIFFFSLFHIFGAQHTYRHTHSHVSYTRFCMYASEWWIVVSVFFRHQITHVYFRWSRSFCSKMNEKRCCVLLLCPFVWLPASQPAYNNV